MTAAERQRKRRERLGIGLPAVMFAATRPWDGTLSRNRRETATIDRIEWWLENGDADAVTEWLTFHLSGRDDGPAAILEGVRRRSDELEAEAIEDERRRLSEE